jgi:hypothetical protein
MAKCQRNRSSDWHRFGIAEANFLKARVALAFSKIAKKARLTAARFRALKHENELRASHGPSCCFGHPRSMVLTLRSPPFPLTPPEVGIRARARHLVPFSDSCVQTDYVWVLSVGKKSDHLWFDRRDL